METRLLSICSSQADLSSEPGDTTTSFSVDLGNNTTDLATSIIGFSVESIAFVNLLPNVREGWTMTIVRNGIRWPISIPGNLFYSIEKFAEALQLSFDNVIPPGLLTVSVLEDVGADGGSRLSFQVEDVGFAQAISIFAEGSPLAYAAGIRKDLVLSDGSAPPYAPVFTRTNLNGEQGVVLKSKQITGSRISIDGQGRSTNALATVPITVGYGAIQTFYPNGDSRPTILYGSEFTLNDIDISLCYLDSGTPVYLEDSPMQVTFRLWLDA